MKKILNISLLTFFVSTVSYSAEYGIRASLEKTEHECSFQNPRVTSKVADCGKETNGSLGFLITNQLQNSNFIETELAYVLGDRTFTSRWAPFNDNKQEITVSDHPRALVTLGKKISSDSGFTFSPVVGAGFARMKAKGAQGAANSPFDEKTNNNFLWTAGVSLGKNNFQWSLDYRYIDYGNVETGIGVPNTRDERLKGDMTSHVISISYKY